MIFNLQHINLHVRTPIIIFLLGSIKCIIYIFVFIIKHIIAIKLVINIIQLINPPRVHVIGCW